MGERAFKILSSLSRQLFRIIALSSVGGVILGALVGMWLGESKQGDSIAPRNGRAVFANDDDWWNADPNGTRGDPPNTIKTLQWLEEGNSHLNVLICGSIDARDEVNEAWERFTTTTHTFAFHGDCSGRLEELLINRDVVVIEYVTTGWDLPVPRWDEKDTEALFAHFQNGGRILVMDDFEYMNPLFARFFVSPVDLFTESYQFVESFDIFDHENHIGRAIMVSEFSSAAIPVELPSLPRLKPEEELRIEGIVDRYQEVNPPGDETIEVAEPFPTIYYALVLRLDNHRTIDVIYDHQKVDGGNLCSSPKRNLPQPGSRITAYGMVLSRSRGHTYPHFPAINVCNSSWYFIKLSEEPDPPTPTPRSRYPNRYPQCNVEPAQAKRGETVTITATGFQPNAGRVEFYLGIESVGKSGVDTNGNATIAVEIPESTGADFELVSAVLEGTAVEAVCVVEVS